MITCTFEGGQQGKLRHVTVCSIIVNDKNQILLTRRSSHLSNGNKFTVPGGYLDRGETTQEGALRELTEETGYTGVVKSLFQIIDNPNRPKEDRQNVEFRYIVEVTGGEPTLNSEVSEIRWFDENNLPAEEEFAFDHRESILLYFQYLEKPFVIPMVGTVPAELTPSLSS
jgi:8-oxo-dGTP diphosphatase